MSKDLGVCITGIAAQETAVCITKEEFANGRKEDKLGRPVTPEKLEYLGIDEFGFFDIFEDSVSIGAGAAKRLLEQTNTDLEDVEILFVGTECGVDHSKANASYIYGLLQEWFGETEGHCHTVDHKMACAAGTEALLSAAARVDGGWIDEDKVAIAIMADEAKYAQWDPAENTSGAHAIAVEVRKVVDDEHDPIIKLGKINGVSSGNHRDFFRPLWSETPTVDGKHSNDVFLKLTKGSVAHYQEKYNKQLSESDVINAKPIEYPLLESDKILPTYHIPYGDQAVEGYRYQIRHELREKMLKLLESGFIFDLADEEWNEILAVMEKEPKRLDTMFSEGEEGDREFAKADRAHRKLLATTQLYQRKVKAHKLDAILAQPRRTGNGYTSSMWSGLHSALENAFEYNLETEEKEMVYDLAGYIWAYNSFGSGGTSVTGTGKILKPWHVKAKTLDLNKRLPERTRTTFSQYQGKHAINKSDEFLKEHGIEKLTEPISVPKPGTCVFKGEDMEPNREGFRHYEWVKEDD